MLERRRVLFGAALAAAGAAAGLLVLELGARASSGRWALDNEVERALAPDPATVHLRFDPALGWDNRAGVTVRNWDADVSLGRDGARSNGPEARGWKAGGVLACGDSFTFGDEVPDDATWPAALERRLRLPVSNHGVSGYGFDQAVLRSESLLRPLRPSWLVLGVIADDVVRCGCRERYGRAKPYFEPAPDGLTLRSGHVAPATPYAVGPVRRWLGYSELASVVARRLSPVGGISGRPSWIFAHREGDAVACALVARARVAAAASGARVLLVGLPSTPDEPDAGRVAALLRCAERSGVPTLDALSLVGRLDPERRRRLFVGGRGHLSREGNELIAQAVARRLEGRGWRR